MVLFKKIRMINISLIEYLFRYLNFNVDFNIDINMLLVKIIIFDQSIIKKVILKD